MQRHCAKCAFETNYNAITGHREGECENAIKEQERDFREAEQNHKLGAANVRELETKFKIETKKYNLLSV